MARDKIIFILLWAPLLLLLFVLEGLSLVLGVLK